MHNERLKQDQNVCSYKILLKSLELYTLFVKTPYQNTIQLCIRYKLTNREFTHKFTHKLCMHATATVIT